MRAVTSRVGHGQVGEKVELLVDCSDAERLGVLRGGEDPLLARDLDAAGIRTLGTGQDLEQRRLAGAVLTEQAVDLAGVEIERDVVQRLHAGVELGDPGDPQQRLGHGRCP